MSDQIDTSDAVMLLHSLLSPDIVERGNKLKNGEIGLVHYTTAENAVKMLNSKQFWLRNVRCMNDYSEVQHGITLILNAFHAEESKRRDRLLALCDALVPNAAIQAINAFDEWKINLPAGTFIGCLSETIRMTALVAFRCGERTPGDRVSPS